MTTNRLDDVEAEHQRQAIENLLAEMRAGGNSGHYWNRPQAHLGGRTPTEALASGDEAAVRVLIDEWYDASRRSAEQLRDDPEAMARITAKFEELRAARRIPTTA